MSISLREVARRAGVSPATVSQVMSQRESAIRVSSERAASIVAIAREARYRPNDDVALVVPAVTDHLLDLRLVQALQDHGQTLGLRCLTLRCGPRGVPEPIARWQVGAAIALSRSTPATAAACAERGLPAIAINSERADEHDCVIVDDAAGMRRALAHLETRGVDAIACLLPRIAHRSHDERRRAAQAHDRPVAWIEHDRFDAALDDLQPLASRAERLGVVVLGDWQLALRTALAPLRAGRPVELVSVKRQLSPWVGAATVLDLPLAAMADAAFAMVRAAWDGGELHQPSRRLEPELITETHR